MLSPLLGLRPHHFCLHGAPVYDGLRPAAREAGRANIRIRNCRKVSSFDQRHAKPGCAGTATGCAPPVGHRGPISGRGHPDEVGGIAIWAGIRRAQRAAGPAVYKNVRQPHMPRCPACGPPDMEKAPMYWGDLGEARLLAASTADRMADPPIAFICRF